MGLKRLTHERYARMRAAGTFPEMPVEPVAPIATRAPELTRGGRPQHPGWPRVMVLVRNEQQDVNYDFLAEARTVSEAIGLASRYPYRAMVFSKFGKREYDNGKPMEAGEVK